MWQRLANWVLKNRFVLLIVLFALTGLMGFYASKVKLSYEFARAIPTDNPKYQDYVSFKEMFGDDGNLLVIGLKTKDFFNVDKFNAYHDLGQKLKKVNGVEEMLSIPTAVILKKDSVLEKLYSKKIFTEHYTEQSSLDSNKAEFLNLPFYRGMLYNPDSCAYLMAVKINKDSLNSQARVNIINDITGLTSQFEKITGDELHLSGLPLIRTVIAERIKNEMRFFLMASLLLSAFILFLFFRSISTMLISLGVVVISVVWTLAVIYLCGYKITLLTALIPSLVVVIGIPNCIYFINKYHSSFSSSKIVDLKERKLAALKDMVSKMGVVTLFCNITAAIGFAVFALTKSAILKEFGVVSGISIMLIFVISFVFLPSILSYVKTPGQRQLRYLNNKWVGIFLLKVDGWVFNHKKWVVTVMSIIVIFSIIGITKLKSVAFIVDDLPKKDKIYTDLKFFEHHFRGVMPLEIIIDTKKRNGLTGMKSLAVFEKVDSLSRYISGKKEINKPLSVAEGLKFAKQAFYDNDSTQYLLPNAFDGAFVGDYLKSKKSEQKQNNFSKMLNSFIDKDRRVTRISVNMADIGTHDLPLLLNDISQKANTYFDTSYNVTFTGTSITFLEGSKFIVNGLKDSILWAFLLISACMLYLFKSLRILFCSLIPNLIPLIITAGIMGWVGVPLKPSTVLVFSVALGIAIDITIRFLVNYRQVLPELDNNVQEAVKVTIQQTGLSIIYTSLVLTVGFVVFCGSYFGGTFALGWLTSVTLLTATLTNLIFLPVLLIWRKKAN
jgi:predicted RND superfamily exporter protein